MKTVFTTGEVAKFCKVAPRTVSKWFDSGKLKGYLLPSSQDRRIPRQELIQFLKKHGMPLGDLEEEQLYKVLLIGTCGLFDDRMHEALNDTDKYKVEYASDGFRAGRLVDTFNPDAIILDLSLGRSESIQIVANLRVEDSHTNTLIIGLAGEDEAEPEKLKEYGFDIVSMNPLDPAPFVGRIKEIAKTKREGE